MNKINKLNDLKLVNTPIEIDPLQLYDYIQHHVSLDGRLNIFDLINTSSKSVVVKQVYSYFSARHPDLIKDPESHFGIKQPIHVFDDGRKLPRLLTFKETILARIDNPDLFEHEAHTCTALAIDYWNYKVIEVCEPIIDGTVNSLEGNLTINFKSVDGDSFKSCSNKKMFMRLMGGENDGLNQENHKIYLEYKSKFKERYSFDRDFAAKEVFEVSNSASLHESHLLAPVKLYGLDSHSSIYASANEHSFKNHYVGFIRVD